MTSAAVTSSTCRSPWSALLLLLGLPLAFVSPLSLPGAAATTTEATVAGTKTAANSLMSSSPTTSSTRSPSSPVPIDLRVVFSDIDGTLVHYPPKSQNDNDPAILRLPPSATGLEGVISAATLAACRDLRRRHGIALVLVSGARTSTLLKRLPWLPQADAYASEGGGRIFYRHENKKAPVQYCPMDFAGATEVDLQPFGLKEDLEWRKRMEKGGIVGPDGYRGNEVIKHTDTSEVVPISDRRGTLWDWARTLEQRGFVLDTKGYAACFRINRKHQSADMVDSFDALVRGDLLETPNDLATSTNLGAVDYYPKESGKKNCCAYLLKKLGSRPKGGLRDHAVCLCDDDNDLEMAMACHHAFLPSISSTSMADYVQQHPDQFTVTRQVEDESKATAQSTTAATDLALATILERVVSP